MNAATDRRHMAGFSLLETVVALGVFALAVLALLHLSGQSTRTAATLETATLATVVADNQAAAASLMGAAAAAEPAQGRTVLGGRQWRWTRQATMAGRSGLLQVDILVRQDDQPQVQGSATLWLAP